MTISFQQLRSAIPGAQPSQLDPGQVAFNVSDGTMYLGTGTDTKIDFSGAQVLPAPPAGKGWLQVLLERAALNDFFIANPEAEGRPAPTNEQVLTWNSTEGVAEWQDAGTGVSYLTTSTAVAASIGATTSEKISAAIGNPGYIGINASCIVTGDPGTTYEGLYIWNGTQWQFASHFAFNTASQVPGTNPMSLLQTSTQAILNALKGVDDGLQTQITANDGDIATLQGQMATAQSDIAGLEASKLNKASNIPLPGQILSYDGSGQLWIDDSQGDVTSVTGNTPITVDNDDPQNPVIGINNASTSAPGAVQLYDGVDSSSNQLAATANSARAAFDAAYAAQATANAAVPRASYAAAGDILVGSAPGAFGPLGIGNEGDVLVVSGGIPTWVVDAPGDVTGVTGTAPITVDNADPENPVVGIDLATTATPGVVQVNLTGNLTLVGGVIDVPDGSTTAKGAVQLNNTLSSTSTTEALTAAAGYALQQQIDALVISASTSLAGGWNASTGVIQGVTADGAAAGFVNGDPLPAPSPANEDYYLICVVSGTDPSPMENGDWLLSDGASWQVLAVGPRSPQASYTQAGIVQLADGTAVETGTSDTLAITPQALQDNVIDSVTTVNSSQIASATAVNTAYVAAQAAQTSADAAQATANAALPLAGGTLTGTVVAQNVNVQNTYSLQFAGGVNGSLNAVTDAVNVTSSTTAASATAVKAANDAAVAAGIVAASAQQTADEAIPDATFTATGDILYGTGAGTYTVLPTGTSGQILTVSSGGIPQWSTGEIGLVGFTNAERTALGVNALNSVTDPFVNVTAIGVDAGTALTDGDRSTFVGYLAGSSVTDAFSNTFVGHQAGLTSTGGGNTSVGSNAGPAGAATASVFVGVDAGSLASGDQNVGVGTSALAKATGNFNVGVGQNAGAGITSGSSNTFVGRNSGNAVTTGTNNVIVGNYTGTATLSNNFVVCGGTDIKIQINENDALSIGTLNDFGTAGQVLTSQGSGAAAIWTTPATGDITAVTAGSGLTGGGTSGDVTLSLDPNAVIAPTLLTATGDIIIASAANTPARLGIGTSGQVLTVVGGVPAWASASASLSGYTNTATPFNTALGGNAGDSITTGVNNTSLGYNAGTALTAGNNNTYVGFGAGDAATSGDNNTGLGSNALGAAGTNNNTGLGANTGAGLTTGSGNTFVGANAGDAATTADNAVAVGFNALGAAHTVAGTVAVGANALAAATSGALNTAIGFNAGTAVTTGCQNTLVGACAGDSISTGTTNTIVGYNAGCAITTAGANTIMGWNAGAGSSTLTDTVAIGYNALSGAVVTGLGTVAIGLNALCALTSGACNTAVGYNAAASLTTGGCNIALGSRALDSAIGGAANVAVGVDALTALTSGDFNTAIGHIAADAITTGANNVSVGYSAHGSGNPAQQVAVGKSTLQSSSATGSVAVGFEAALNSSTGLVTAIGYNALRGATTGTNNTAVGYNAGTAITTGSDNVFIGHNAGDAATGLSQAVAIGSNALGAAAATTGTVAVGASALAALTTGDRNVAVGYLAGTSVTSGLGNTLIGYRAGDAISTTSNNTIIGNDAGNLLSAGGSNVFIGSGAGDTVSTGSSNTIIGSVSGSGALANNLILAAGSTIKLQVNENGAVGVGATPAYGSTGQVLTSNGTGAAPAWTDVIWQNLTTQTLSTTTPTTILTLPIATFRGATINISVSNPTTANFHNDIWMVIHDGTSATAQLTGSGGHIGSSPYSLSATISGTDLLVQVSSAAASATKYVGIYQTFAI